MGGGVWYRGSCCTFVVGSQKQYLVQVRQQQFVSRYHTNVAGNIMNMWTLVWTSNWHYIPSQSRQYCSWTVFRLPMFRSYGTWCYNNDRECSTRLDTDTSNSIVAHWRPDRVINITPVVLLYKASRSLQSWVSTIQSAVLTADVFQFFAPCSLQSWVSTIQSVVLTAGVLIFFYPGICFFFVT